ncbi:MAG: toprim domain-containing protein [Terriglobales bacterium]
MTNELTRAILHYKATLSGGAYIGTCPLCSHHCLVLSAGKKHPVACHCFRDCPQDALYKLVRTVAEANTPIATKIPDAPAPKTFTESELFAKLAPAESQRTTALPFLEQRGITLAVAQQHRLGVVHIHGCQRLVLPYLAGTFSEHIFQLRYRALDPSDDLPKWTCEKIQLGVRRLFNLPLLAGWSPNDVQPLVITESELDCLMLLSIGIAACSVDTAYHKLSPRDLAALQTVKYLVLAFDLDEAGNACTARFKAALPQAKILEGFGAKHNVKDLGELRLKVGTEAFAAGLQRFLQKGKHG